jgi:hypothetical protein
MSIREGLWDCPSCGNQGILGRQRSCPSCNTPRADDVHFYLPKDAREITSFTQISDATAGADWHCQHCNSGNPASATSCKQCGASRGSSAEHETRTYAPENVPHSAKDAAPSAAVAPPPRKSSKGKYIAGGLVVSTAFGLYIASTPSQIPVTVSGFGWERSVVVEEQKAVRKQAWEVPQGGHIISQARAFHHNEDIFVRNEQRTRQVCENVQTGTTSYNCGSRDLGNGYFEDKTCTRPVYSQQCHSESYQEPIYRQEPRYATQYTFDIDEWVQVSQPSLARQNHTPVWPQVKLGNKQRTSDPQEHYSVTLQDKDGKTYSYALDFKRWESLKTGQPFTAEVDMNDEVLELTPPDKP